MNELSKEGEKTCAICLGGSVEIDSELFLGPWMQKSDIIVHYNCLLLSTNLPQRGEECGGINGFLMRDIRVEIAAAGKRICFYCDKIGASIRCNRCKRYFHIGCGIRNYSLFQFVGEFKSFCNFCIPLDTFQKKAKKRWKSTYCYICKEYIASGYIPTEQLYAPCCQNGFVHRSCMQQYALSAGYYLRCIFCRSTSFRESIRLQGIFVPDREAKWETKTAYRDLHRGHCRCDVEHCLCERGREYKSKRWNLINCSFCGSFGVHYPLCIPKLENGSIPSIENFRCITCGNTERNVFERTMRAQVTDNVADYFDLYIHKTNIQRNNEQRPASSTHRESQFAEDDRITNLQEIKTVKNDVVSPVVEDMFLNDSEMNCNNMDGTEMLSTQSFSNLGGTEMISTQSFSSSSDIECSTSDNCIDLTKDDDKCNFEEFEIIDFNADFEMIGTCKFRINMKSPRFVNKSLKNIANNPEILRESDIVERTGDIMPFEKIKYIMGGREGDEFLSRHCPEYSEGGGT